MMQKSTPGVPPLKSIYVSVTSKNWCEEEGEEGKYRILFFKIALFDSQKIGKTMEKSTPHVKDTDHMEIPRILMKQKV